MASDDITSTGGVTDPWDGIARAMANSAMNATAQQQQMAVTAQASVTQGLATLYAVDTAALGIASKKLLSK